MKNKFTVLLIVTALLLGGCAGVSEARAVPEQTSAPMEEAEPKMRLASVTIEGIMGDITSSTTTEFHYDEKGFLCEMVAFANGEEVSRSAVLCDDQGNPIRETSVSGGVTTVTESQLTYSEAGELIQKTSTVTVDGTVTDVREYHYKGEGKLAEAKFYRGGETEPYSYNRYEYNDQGQEVLQIVGSAGSEGRMEAEYDAQGRKVRAVQKNSQGEILVTVDYAYEEEGKVVQTNTYPDGRVLTVIQLEYEEGSTNIAETYMDGVLSTRVSSTYVPIEQEG